MKKIISRAMALAVLAACLVASPTWARGAFFFRNGDRVAFIGDSITEQALYTTYIETYLLSRFPHWKLSARNVGWGGDTAWFIQRGPTNEGQLFSPDPAVRKPLVARAVRRGLERDVMPLHPTAATVDMGMNDARRGAKAIPAYRESLTEMVRELQATGARVALLSPSPEERNGAGPAGSEYNLMLAQYSDAVRAVARQDRIPYVDQLHPFIKVIEAGRKRDPAFKVTFDGVHPKPPGHLVMAWAILRGLHAPSLVSSVAIDAAGPTVTDHARCRITNLRHTAGGVSFDRLDGALPWPVPPETRATWDLAPIFHDLDRYELQVEGLTAPRYDVRIDGNPAGTFTAEDLARGVNLADSAAVWALVQPLHDLVVKKNQTFFERWRRVQLGKPPADADAQAKQQAELKRLDREVADLEAQINVARLPKLHHFEVVPATP